MTAATDAPPQPPVRRSAHPTRWWYHPAVLGSWIFGLGNAIAFFILRPGVSDLWAARARASAVEHGVGLDYWFGWFGGGSTPGNYSILTPYTSALIGTETLGALSAIAVTVLITVAVRDTPHASVASAVGAVAVALNLWSGRVPFLFGGAAAVGAVIAVRHGKRTATVALTLFSILASPVAGAFVVMGLSGTFLTTRTKQYRPIIAYAVCTAGVAILLSTLAFGAPGPEPFSNWLLLELVGGFLLLWLVAPPDHMRTTFWVTVIAAVALWAIPNGLGSNMARFVWFCLPVAFAALSRRSSLWAALAVTPLLIVGSVTTATDLFDATEPVSSVSYYASLANRLDSLPDLRNHRLELVEHGGRAGYDALLDHAMLARGWETQEDQHLNGVLYQSPLDPITYKVWLDNNAVGYVALPATQVRNYPEYTLVSAHTPSYLQRIWYDTKWDLFRVLDPTPIVGQPGSILGHDQKSMTIKVPYPCRIAVRVRWSKFLSAVLQGPDPSGSGTTDAEPIQRANVADDGFGWAVLTMHKAGTYVLRGSIRGLLH
jgi:hypothetical protein